MPAPETPNVAHMIETVAFVGIGRMGGPMARRMAAAGYSVLAHDRDRDAVAAFHRAQGTAPANDVDAQAGRADAVVTMLPTSAIVRDVLLGSPGGEPGLAERLRPGSVVIDMSTSDPQDTHALGAALSARGLATVDAPVAGGVVYAKDGTLDILAGGEAALVDRLRPLLLTMGHSVLYCGGLGTAHAMKALNNYVNAAVLAVNLEALVAGRAFGIELPAMLRALEASTLGRNHPYEKKVKPHVLTRSFASGMGIGLIAKDVDIARSVAAAQSLPAPLAERVAELWRQAADEIGFERDQTEIVRYWERAAGLSLSDTDGA